MIEESTSDEKPYLGETPGYRHCWFTDSIDEKAKFKVRDIERYKGYAKHIYDAFERLAEALDKITAFKIDKYAILSSLLEHLCAILDEQIVDYIHNKKTLEIKSPAMLKLNEALTENFINASIESFERMNRDFNTIKNGFLSELDEENIRLTKISSSGSDFHKKGRHVKFLTFEDDEGHVKKVVYKPSSMVADAMIAGNVQRLKDINPDFKWMHSLRAMIETCV